MAYFTTVPLIGALALAGVGAGIHLGHSAIAEINPIHFSEAPSRFHSDLSPNRPSDSAPGLMLARADDPALGTGCIGCRTYPEEYYPIHDASLDRYSSGYAVDVEEAEALVARAEPDADPEAARMREAIRRVERFAHGEAVPAVELASAEPEAVEAPLEEPARTD